MHRCLRAASFPQTTRLAPVQTFLQRVLPRKSCAAGREYRDHLARQKAHASRPVGVKPACRCKQACFTACAEPDSKSAGVDDEELEEWEIDPNKEFWVTAKCMLDGCGSIDEIVVCLQEEVEAFKKLKEEGWEMHHDECVRDGYGTLWRE